MASKHERDRALEGFLNDWEPPEKDKRMKPHGTSSSKMNESGKYSYLRNFDAFMSSSDDTPSAMSEKEQGNEYFKQKKFKEAIDCYSKSIGLSPTAVVYANRAMAYLKIKRFREAEDDCTEALNLDDRYIKAYSRRSTARKELKKFKESMEDAEFALKLEPNNQEVKKQFSEAKSIYEKDLLQRTAGALHRTTQGAENSKETKGVQLQELSSSSVSSRKIPSVSAPNEVITKKNPIPSIKHEQKPSVQELAARASSLALNETSQIILPPNSAYQFEVTWRGFSGDRTLEARLLKATSPSALPWIFKNAMTATMLMDIIKCLATIFDEETELTVQYLENLTKVSRFDMVVLCLSSVDKADMANIWLSVFSNKAIPIEYSEKLESLRPKYCR